MDIFDELARELEEKCMDADEYENGDKYEFLSVIEAADLLRKRIGPLIRALEDKEFVVFSGVAICPWCDKRQFVSEMQGGRNKIHHAPDCQRQSALAVVVTT